METDPFEGDTPVSPPRRLTPQELQREANMPHPGMYTAPRRSSEYLHRGMLMFETPAAYARRTRAVRVEQDRVGLALVLAIARRALGIKKLPAPVTSVLVEEMTPRERVSRAGTGKPLYNLRKERYA